MIPVPPLAMAKVPLRITSPGVAATGVSPVVPPEIEVTPVLVMMVPEIDIPVPGVKAEPTNEAGDTLTQWLLMLLYCNKSLSERLV